MDATKRICATGESAIQPHEKEETLSLLRTLLEGDDEEQRETFAFLRQALDQDRPSDCKLFPTEDEAPSGAADGSP